MAPPTNCGDVADLLAELATGAASGPDRALVLSHLAGCEESRRDLDTLIRVADDVLAVAPLREPPAGFESSVLARISEPAVRPRVWSPPASEPRRRHPALRAVAVAASTASLICAVAAGWWATSDERQLAAEYRRTLAVADGSRFTAAPVRDSSDAEVGAVFLYQGEPSWVFALLRDAPEPGSYDIVVATGRRADAVGTCEVETATCAGGATMLADIDAIEEVRLVATSGGTLTASLTR